MKVWMLEIHETSSGLTKYNELKASLLYWRINAPPKNYTSRMTKSICSFFCKYIMETNVLKKPALNMFNILIIKWLETIANINSNL